MNCWKEERKREKRRERWREGREGGGIAVTKASEEHKGTHNYNRPVGPTRLFEIN